jgi:hypothetical protein
MILRIGANINMPEWKIQGFPIGICCESMMQKK